MTITIFEKAIHRNVELRIKFEPRDLWIGAYWNLVRSIESDYRRLDIYLCLLPMLVLHFRFEWGWK